jgi:transcriptional regulator with XRE-family HTH domain
MIPERLKKMRESRGLSQAELAKKARLNKQTIYRIENGKQPAREKTIQRLARALEVDPGALTGEKPMPTDREQRPEETEQVQLNVRVDEAIRNAFSLVSLRYRIPARRIVEVAPLLFVFAAEGSLKRRREKLEELNTAYKQAADLRYNFRHLPACIAEPYVQEEPIGIESESIFDCDLFGSATGNLPEWYDPGYDDEEDNPFVAYLKELATAYQHIVVAAVGPTRTDYEVGRSEALDLAGGDERLAKRLIDGTVLIHEIPRNLLGKEAAAERVDWLHRKCDEADRRLREALEGIDAFFDDDDSEGKQ